MERLVTAMYCAMKRWRLMSLHVASVECQYASVPSKLTIMLYCPIPQVLGPAEGLATVATDRAIMHG